MTKFIYTILRNNLPVGVMGVSSASITCDTQAEIKRRALISAKDMGALNVLTDSIKIQMGQDVSEPVTWGYLDYADITWEQLDALNITWGELDNLVVQYNKLSPLGVFIPTTPTVKGGVNKSVEIECYDLAVILKNDAITERLYFEAGTKYTEAIAGVLLSAGITEYSIADSDAIFLVGRSFEIGTPKIEIVNTLLDEINYRDIYFDRNGIAMCIPFEEPQLNSDTIIYKDKLSAEYSETFDLYNIPNVFVATVANPDNDSVLTSVYVNDNPASSLSTVNRRNGQRVVKTYTPDNISSQADLDAYVYRKAFEESQVYKSRTINTALNPNHDVYNTVFLDSDNLKGLHDDIGYTMQLTAGGSMQHNLREVIRL